jgi:hypothetical protein
MEQRIVIKFLGENVSTNNNMGKSVSHGPVCLSGVSASERAESAWRMNRVIVGRE